MENQKFTPGPWYHALLENGNKMICTKSGGILAVIQPNFNNFHSGDANLMAAAPQLLEALENLWKSCIPKEQSIVGRIHLEDAFITIKKAKGDGYAQ